MENLRGESAPEGKSTRSCISVCLFKKGARLSNTVVISHWQALNEMTSAKEADVTFFTLRTFFNSMFLRRSCRPAALSSEFRRIFIFTFSRNNLGDTKGHAGRSMYL